MLIRLVAVVCCTAILGGLCFAQSSEDSLTITTYYPSPYGVYKNLRLHPSDEPKSGVDRGVMYYNSTENKLMYRNDTTWVNLTGVDCVLKRFALGSTNCPSGYFTWPGHATAASGDMLCCTISRRVP